MDNYKRYVSEKQWRFLVENLPEPRQKRRERKRCKKEDLVTGILQILKTGCRWRDVNGGCSGVSCWRYFNKLQKRGAWKKVFQLSVKLKYKKRKGQPVRKALDGIVFSKGNIHDRKLAESTNLDSLSNGAKKALSLAADKGYDDAAYRYWLRSKKIKPAIPGRKYEKRKRKKGRPFSCKKEYYEIRYVIERTNGWIEGFRRIKLRYERKFSNFAGMVLLASTLINVRLRK